MILYMCFDDWGREFTHHARGAVCVDGAAGRTPDELLSDMSNKLEQVLVPNPPAFAVFLPCCFFTRDCQPHERTREILIRAAALFKRMVAGIPNLVLPCVYADDLLESKAQDEESRTRRMSLDEFLAFLNKEMAQAVRSIQNPCIDRVLLFEKRPYGELAMDQYELFNCLENFLEVIRKDACTNLTRISIMPQLPSLRGNPDLQGENIPFYGTLRMQKLEHPKAFFVARQASHDFLHIL